MKSKAQNPFLEQNLIIFSIIKTQNVKRVSVLPPETLSEPQLILSPKSFLEEITLHRWTGESHAGVI